MNEFSRVKTTKPQILFIPLKFMKVTIVREFTRIYNVGQQEKLQDEVGFKAD